MLPRILLTTLLALITLRGFAGDTPEAVVTRQLDAMRAGDWDKFTACMDGAVLQEFQANVLGMLATASNDTVREQALRMFFNDKTVAELNTITPTAFFGVFMNGLVRTNPILKQSMSGATGQIIGHVDEPPDKTHVLVRMTMPVGDSKITKMDVTSLQREGDSWKALLKGDTQAVVTNLSRMLQPK